MAVDYDGTLKVLVDGNASGFYRLLGSDGPRTLLSTEFNGPLKGRMDHLSRGPGGFLHVEFQSTPDRMNWRMIEYYCAIAREFKSVLAGRESVLQWVLYVGNNNVRFQNHIEQDSLSFEFRTCDIRDLNGSHLLDSRLLSEAILGLFCIQVVHLDYWERVLERIESTAATSLVIARDALAMLLAAIAIRGAPAAIQKRTRTLGMRVNISQSEVLKELVDEKFDAGAAVGTRDALRLLAESKKIVLESDDSDFIDTLSTTAAQQAIISLAKDEDWYDIKVRLRTGYDY